MVTCKFLGLTDAYLSDQDRYMHWDDDLPSTTHRIVVMSPVREPKSVCHPHHDEVDPVTSLHSLKVKIEQFINFYTKEY